MLKCRGNISQTRVSVNHLEYLRPDDVLEILPISRRTLSNWQQRRIVPFHRVGRTVLFKQSDIEEAITRYRVAAIGEPSFRARRMIHRDA